MDTATPPLTPAPKERLERVRQARLRWEERHGEALRGRKKRFRTSSGAEIAPLYTEEHTAPLDPLEDLGLPGEYPYTRGIHATMYRGRLWTSRLFSGYATPEETNRRYHLLLQAGQRGLSVAFDMPTLLGRDSDDPMASGEVGKCGVAVDTLADMETLFQGIPLGEVSTSMTINGPAAVLLAMYLAVAEKQGVPFEQVRGTLQNDILKEYIAQKEWIFPPEPSVKLVVDTVEYCTRHLPQWNTISISGYHIREAGANALQELAFTLADGFHYVEACRERALEVDEFAPRFSFFFDCHNNFFEEIAKFRAARKIYAKVMREKYGARDPRSWKLRFHTQTAGVTLTAQQPENNIVRVAYQALAAVLGGTQSLHTNAMDETLALPTDKAALIALRTQQILAHETGVTDVVDPLGGSYYVEHLTDWMVRRCFEYFQRIEEEGGVLAGIASGFFQREIARSAFEYQQAVERREEIIVGVNDYVVENEKLDIPVLRIGPEVEEFQVRKLREVRSRRNQAAVARALEAVRAACRSGENVMPALLEAVKAYATLGEICGAMKEVYGEYREPVFF